MDITVGDLKEKLELLNDDMSVYIADVTKEYLYSRAETAETQVINMIDKYGNPVDVEHFVIT